MVIVHKSASLGVEAEETARPRPHSGTKSTNIGNHKGFLLVLLILGTGVFALYLD